jgi:hypothetical protein
VRQTEAQFQHQVRDLAELCGWDIIWCTWNSQHSPAGEPDLRLGRIKDKRFVFAELKRDKKSKVAPAQVKAQSDLKAMGMEAYLWTPEDWPEIEEVLR